MSADCTTKVTMGLSRSLLLKASESHWLARNLPRFRFSRRAVKRFMPGEELSDALRECTRFGAEGVGTIITRLGENITTIEEADEVTAHYRSALDDIERRALPTHISVKLTQLGLDISPDHAAACTQAITAQSARLKAPVWIDMESSRYTDVTLDIFRRVRAQHANVGVCLQAYLHRTRDDLENLLKSTTAIRLVKGAYKEPPEVALQQKRAVNQNYVACAQRLLEAVKAGTVGHAPGFATHDVAIIKRIAQHAEQLGVPRDRFEFQMLYGINRAEQQRLASEGYRLRVLISYGSAWFAWYMRRLAERPANVWFVLQSAITA
jgi:proline dehydrogenase